MTIDITSHKTILFQILKDIYLDTQLAPYLGFKGGTAALFFYNLSRFSVDLDFDLLDDEQEDLVYAKILQISKKYGKIKESYKKSFSLIFILSYNDAFHNIKIEINKRKFNSKYETKLLLGASIQVMTKEDMFAHKLVAMHERIGKTSRDIYDVWFFLKERFPINKEIVELRMNNSFTESVQICIMQLEKLSKNKLLLGVGELLDENQKQWAKKDMINDLVALLRLRV